MKPTLEEIKDNYERVLLQLENGHLAGIKKLSRSSDYSVVEQQDWIGTRVRAIELAKGYERESLNGFNIDKIKFLSDRNEVNEFLQYEECEIDWDWDINNPHNLKFKKRDYIIKGDKNNMYNILEIYVDRRREKISKKYNEVENSVKLTDPRYKVWKECVDTLDKLYAEDKVVGFAHANIELSEDTKKKLHTLYEARDNEVRKLIATKHEIDAQMEMCETYDQKQEILRRYNIINKNGKINA